MKWWWQLKKSESDLDRELRSDLDLEEEEQRENGLAPEEASYAARRAFGNDALIKEETREAWGWVPFESVSQDVRYAIRQLLKHRIFTAVCVITLGAGVAATTSVFSVVDSFLFRPLPYPNAPRIVRVWNTFSPQGMTEIPASEPEFNEYRQSGSLAHFAGFSVGAVTITGGGDPLHAPTSWGTAEFFDVLGVQPALGRVFTSDEKQGKSHVAILSYSLWRSRFGRNPSIVGKSIHVDSQDCTIVGVMPSDFAFPSKEIDIWQPLSISTASSNVGLHYLNLVADLKPQSTLQSASSEMNTILKRVEDQYPTYYSGAAGLGVNLVPLREQMVGNLRPTLLILMAGVAFMLVIACTNVASLLLARAEDRKREIATRAALGATRARILRQVLTETLLLFLGSGAIAVLLAAVIVKLLSVGKYLHLESPGSITVDSRVLSFSILVSIATGVLFGLMPALKASQSNFTDVLKIGGREAMTSRDRSHTRSVLVISEIAFSLVLLTGAGLMIASLVKLLGVNLGFDPQNVVTMKLSIPRSRYSLESGAALYQQLQDGIRHLPGVQAVALVNQLPMSDVTANASFDVEGTASKNQINVADTQIISPDYFRVMGISFIKGRPFNEQDVDLPPASVIVNQVFARKVWPGVDPLGKRIRLRSDAPWLSVVGVVANIKNHGSYLPTKPEMYFVYTDKPFGVWADLMSMTVVVRTAFAPHQIIGAIRDQLRHLDPELPIYGVTSLEQVVSSSISGTRYPAFAFSLFACASLILAGIGAYGVLAYTVAQRRHEIGLRMALGAQRSQVLRSFLVQGMRWAGIGGAAGLVAALLLVRFMRSILFEIGVYDPRILLAAGVVLLTAVLLACAIPALKATKINPMIALRSE